MPRSISVDALTHCIPLAPYGNVDLGQHFSSDDSLSDSTKLLPEPLKVFCGIHLRAI